MQRRTLILSAAAGAAVLAGCTTNTGPSPSAAEKKAEIDRGVTTTLATLYGSVKGSRELASKASGILVFPSVFSAGLVVGGEYGEGALLVGGNTAGYYKTTTASFGFQAGAQSRALVLLFMTQDALNKFRSSSGWTAGVDATVSLIKVGANGIVDTSSASATVNAFALTNSGLMAGISIDGSKVSKMDL